MSRILVTGAGGQLGRAVMQELRRRRQSCVGVGSREMDVTDPSQVARTFESVRPTAVIHCAAYTAVDQAEEEPARCHLVNVEGTRHVAQAAVRHAAKLMYISTDYVFDGSGSAPWPTDAVCAPLNVYGQSKCAGEHVVAEAGDRHFIVRISWVFGPHGRNFVRTMLKLAQTRDTLQVVADQIGSPTYTPDLAALLCGMIESDCYGVYHATNEGYCSWYDFACHIFEVANRPDIQVTPVDSAAFPTRARRPLNSRLAKDSLDAAGFRRLPVWQDAVKRYVEELQLSSTGLD